MLFLLARGEFTLMAQETAPASAREAGTLYVREYRVTGADRLPKLEVEEAVYPFLGPGRTPADVEAARAALEKAYHDKGLQTVSVIVPEQDPRRGVIRLEVVEGKVGRLRITGSRYFLPGRIRREAPSMAEGEVPDMKRVEKEIIALNRMSDRRVTPQLKPGVVPGTVDIDLEVEDKLPLHGSFELNNRNSANTSGLRLSGALSYGNVFQLGHTLGGSFQIAPQNLDDSEVYTGYYLARVSSGVSLMLQGTKQDSDVSTLGDAASIGRGHVIGLQALYDLPTGEGFYQNFSLGMDYKHFSEDLVVGKSTISSPIEYYPVSANYGASWLAEKAFTEANLGLTFHLRGMGTGVKDYANKRYGADASFVVLKGDVAHTRDLRDNSQLFFKVQGQVASQALVNNEQFSGGGLGSVRGYLEATALGDNGAFGTFEYRTPSLIGTRDKNGEYANEWRFHLFTEGGITGIYDALPGQQKRYGLASAGGGTRFKLKDHYNGSLDVGVPFIGQTDAKAGEVRVTFRGWADF